MKKVSDKLGNNLKIYNVLRKDFLLDHPVCEAGVTGCKYHATEIHHKRGRGKNLTEVSTFLAVCNHCHQWIERFPAKAKELGFSESRLKKQC